MNVHRELTEEEWQWIEEWLPRLPMRVAREAVYTVTGGLIKPQTLNTCDSLGNGPAVRYKVGKKVIYDMRTLLEWIVRKDGIKRLLDLDGMAARTGSRRPREAKKDEDARNAASSQTSCAA